MGPGERRAKSAALYRDAWSEFVNVLGKRELPRLDRERYGYRIPTPGLKPVDGQVRCSLEIPGFVLRYTTDGSEPTEASPEVEDPSRPGVVRVAAFDTRAARATRPPSLSRDVTYRLFERRFMTQETRRMFTTERL